MGVRDDGDLLQVAVGRHHAVCLKRDGSMYTWGLGLSGQLGINKQEIVNVDNQSNRMVHPLQDHVVYYKQVGYQTSPDKYMEVELRDPETWIPLTGKPLSVMFGHKVKQISCGAYHTMLITDENYIFGCGLNTHGQIGVPISVQKMQSTLNLITTESSSKAYLKKELTDLNNIQPDYGTELLPTLTKVPVTSAVGFAQVACGEDFTLLLTNNGNVLSTGNGSMGIHCLDSVKLRTEFAAIGSENLKGGFFEDGGIIQIAAGEAHCGALDKHGQAFLWGRNEYGECGEKPEITKIVTSPRQVKAKV